MQAGQSGGGLNRGPFPIAHTVSGEAWQLMQFRPDTDTGQAGLDYP